MSDQKTDKRSKPDEAAKSVTRPSNVRRFWRAVFFLGLVVLALPSVLTVSGRTKSALSLFAPRLAGATRFDSAVLHWWSPVEIRGLTIADASLQSDTEQLLAPLFQARQITTTQPLWKVVTQMGRDIQVNIQSPQLNLRVHDGRTNLEESLTALFPSSQTSTSQSSWPITIEVADGAVLISSEQHDDLPAERFQTKLAGINGRFSTRNRFSLLPELTLAADVVRPTDPTVTTASDPNHLHRSSGVDPRIAANLDSLAADFPLQPFEPPATDDDTNSSQSHIVLKITAPTEDDSPGHIGFSASNLSLADLQPLIERWLPGTLCTGRIACRLQARLIGRSLHEGVAGRLQVSGREIHWQDPRFAQGESLTLDQLTLNGAAAVAEDGILLNDVTLDSSIIQCQGGGELRVASIDPLIDMLQSAGKNVSGDAGAVISEAKAASAGKVTLNGQINLQPLTAMLPRTLALQDGVTVQDGSVRFAVRIHQPSGQQDNRSESDQPAAGNVSPQWQVAIQTTPLTVLSAGRTMNLELPVRLDADGPFSTQSITLRAARLSGMFGELNISPRISAWMISGTLQPQTLWKELNQFVAVAQPGIRGSVNVRSTVEASGSRIRLSDTLIESTDLRIDSQKLVIDSALPVMQMFDGSLSVSGNAGAIKTLIAPWHSASWMSSASHATVKFMATPDRLMRLQGQLTPMQTAVYRTPPFRTISNTSTVADAAAMTLNQLAVELNILADESGSSFHVEQGRIQIPGLDAAIRGTLSTPAGLLNTDLIVDATYNLDILADRLLNDPQRAIQLTGQGTEQFRIQGSPSILTAADLNQLPISDSQIVPLSAVGRISWDGGNLWGLRLGPGATNITLDQGLLRTEPIHCQVNSGNLHVMPQYDLNTNRIQLATGSRVENLDITDELCSEWLGYVAPMLADSAQVSGHFSARVHHFDYDLETPPRSTIQSVLTIHDATASPGSSLLSVLQAIDMLHKGNSLVRNISMPAQDIAFELRNGFIQHDNAAFDLSGYRLRTSGAVSLDRRLQLTMDIPLEKTATADSRPPARSVQVPVSGSIDQPQIDLSSLLQNLGTQKLQDKLDNELDRQLKKLFDRF